MNLDSKQLLKLAEYYVLNPSEDIKVPNLGRWEYMRNGVFVTAYNGGYAPGNLWCCVSNGNFDDTVKNNVIGSSILCTQDPRRHGIPDTFEITIMQKPSLWKKVGSLGTLDRRRQRVIVIIGDKNQRTFFLPSVWNENPEWTARYLINQLERKGGYKAKEIYEVANIVIGKSEEHHGMI